ncbi:Gfo/Idh/MocA family oxidoreductase [Microbacterium sp. LRZ72]|uniref:Gfo/Idh/MocA family protein n=1 Tax=Microbacterium sp. LRZ72 TaxID=2942481 RepID=UPI0029A07762|nr:Gfo/Idh/MocA family oxidoreductase [Microbacterium sp. LRZ72]MDX2377817.1 Gfo/Idh/MocA family oxidoreductase [Microbacterium sp. LRZ72]
MAGLRRAGVIGGGFMAEVHARAIRAAGHEVHGIASSSPESGRLAARRLGVPIAFDSAEALIAADEIDVVHVCTPNALHFEQASAAIQHGKSVVCEKPLAISEIDAEHLRRAADDAGAVTAVPFVYRYYPVVREIRERIRGGEAGELLLLHGSYLQDWLANRADTNWRVSSDGGGPSRAFADVGVHWCDLMEFITGHRIVRLSARLVTAHPHRGAPGDRVLNEDMSLLTFETDGGAAGSLTVSQISQGRKNRLWFSFDGTEGSFEFNQETPDSFWIGGIDSSSTVTAGTGGMRSADARRLSMLPAGHPQGYQDAFKAFMSDAYSAMMGEEAFGLPDFSDGFRAAQLTAAVIRSSESQEWVVVPEFESASANERSVR